ncbi:hypothetical protein [Hyphomonas sp.]|uniref:hypothetical protein n=1 Tax=Hyphomonas sp. TaxID=87 RepID=UPI0025C3555C|nr:hypothetical protein [Hyphomonas sp.]
MSRAWEYSIEPIGPVHMIYVGSGPSGILADADRCRIIEMCESRFLSFTCTEARGYFRGKAEETLVIHIATADEDLIIGLAREIAVAQDQLGVGLSGPDANGALSYRRIIPWRQDGVQT